MCSQSAVTINNDKATDPHAEITPKDGMVIQVGKRRFAKVKVE
jgi:tyrosyl-tRNA synthetase